MTHQKGIRSLPYGYNAALMAHIVGKEGRVISVDRDEELVHNAQAHVRQGGYVVEAQTANGLEGYPPANPYDRIIITGGHERIAFAWIEQLTVGGILVGNVLGPLASPLFRVEKQPDGSGQGALLATSALFMRLTSETSEQKRTRDVTTCSALPLKEHAQTALNFPQVLRDPSFALFVEQRLPSLEKHFQYLAGPRHEISSYGTSLFLPEHTLLTFSPQHDQPASWNVEVQGDFPLWSVLSTIYQQWEEQGRPSVESYHLDVQREYHVMRLVP